MNTKSANISFAQTRSDTIKVKVVGPGLRLAELTLQLPIVEPKRLPLEAIADGVWSGESPGLTIKARPAPGGEYALEAWVSPSAESQEKIGHRQIMMRETFVKPLRPGVVQVTYAGIRVPLNLLRLQPGRVQGDAGDQSGIASSILKKSRADGSWDFIVTVGSVEHRFWVNAEVSDVRWIGDAPVSGPQPRPQHQRGQSQRASADEVQRWAEAETTGMLAELEERARRNPQPPAYPQRQQHRPVQNRPPQHQQTQRPPFQRPSLQRPAEHRPQPAQPAAAIRPAAKPTPTPAPAAVPAAKANPVEPAALKPAATESAAPPVNQAVPPAATVPPRAPQAQPTAPEAAPTASAATEGEEPKGGATVALALPANCTATIRVVVTENPDGAAVANAAAVVRDTEASKPQPEAVPSEPEASASAKDTAVAHSRTAVAEAALPEGIDPKSPMGKFLRRQQATQALQRQTAQQSPMADNEAKGEKPRKLTGLEALSALDLGQ